MVDITNKYIDKNGPWNLVKSEDGKQRLATVRAGNVIGGGDYSEDRLIPDIYKSAKKTKLLEGMTEAVWGFWGIGDDALGRGKNQQDYELRFYGSHQEAVELGTVPADDRTGEDAKIRSKPPNEATWKELLKESRECQGEGGHHTGACIVPKYGDYIIFEVVNFLTYSAI